MTFAVSNLPGAWPRAWLLAGVIFAAPVILAQTSQPGTPQSLPASGSGSSTLAPSRDPARPPVFSAAGVQGSTSPSGYSTGISREESSAVSAGVQSLSHELLSNYVSEWPAQNCSLEPGLWKAAHAHPQAYETNLSLGLFYLEHSEFARSLPYLETAHRLNAADQRNLHALALALLGDKKSQPALDLLRAAMSISGQDPALLRLLALAYQTAGDEVQALESYRRAIAAFPNDAGNLLAAGFGLIGTGAPQEATDLFSSATARHPNNAKLWLGLGIGQDMLGHKPQAVRSLLQAIAIDQDLAAAYLFLAALADASAESATAMRTRLADFVIAHPSSAAAHYDYGLALWLQSKRDFAGVAGGEVESQLRLALAADPDMAKAHYLLGVLYSDASDLPRAERELSEAARLEPGNAEAHYRLAQDYKRSHNAGLAATEMRQFLALHGSGNPEEPIASPQLQDAGGDPVAQLMTASPCDGGR